MSMFDNYQMICNANDLSNPYAADVKLQIKPRQPLELLNAKNEFIGYGWHQGEPIVLEFTTTGYVTYDAINSDESPVWVDAETYLHDKSLKFEMFNFRYEKVCELEMPGRDVVEFIITSEMSAKLCKGLYYGRLTVIDEENDLMYVLADKDICKFYVR